MSVIIRRDITVSIVEDIERHSLGIEVTVPEGMTTLEAVGLLEAAKIQYLQSKHQSGPTVYQWPDGASGDGAVNTEGPEVNTE